MYVEARLKCERMEKERVCVTGADGYATSWLVNLLLSNNYFVHGTVRNLDDEKYGHLKQLEKAKDKLELMKADLLDYSSLLAAFTGCAGVFHVACPVPDPRSVIDPQTELMDPAVKGTLNVVKACSEANVKRVVVVSSVGAITMNPTWPKDKPMDENCWSDKEYCRTNKLWYYLSKTEAESEALEFGKRYGLEVKTICPTLITGPMLQGNVNFSSSILIEFLKGNDIFQWTYWESVDVRDLAEALLLVYEKPESNGRYICTSHRTKVQDLVEMLRKHYPNYTYPASFKDGMELKEFSAIKLRTLGWNYRSLEESMIDSIENYKRIGDLD